MNINFEERFEEEEEIAEESEEDAASSVYQVLAKRVVSLHRCNPLLFALGSFIYIWWGGS